MNILGNRADLQRFALGETHSLSGSACKKEAGGL
jgi:hypothetical protein